MALHYPHAWFQLLTHAQRPAKAAAWPLCGYSTDIRLYIIDMVLAPIIGRSYAVAGKENNPSISSAASNRHSPESSAAWTRGGVRKRRVRRISEAGVAVT